MGKAAHMCTFRRVCTHTTQVLIRYILDKKQAARYILKSRRYTLRHFWMRDEQKRPFFVMPQEGDIF